MKIKTNPDGSLRVKLKLRDGQTEIKLVAIITPDPGFPVTATPKPLQEAALQQAIALLAGHSKAP